VTATITGPFRPFAIDLLFANQTPPVPRPTLGRLAAFADEWSGKVGNEQQLAQMFRLQPCTALGTAPPHVSGTEGSDYCFERRVVVRGGGHGRIELYKRGADPKVTG